MWGPLRKILARSKSLGATLGEVICETPPTKGVSSHSLFQWRVKKGLDPTSFFIALKLRADAYAGAEGSPTNYISFDIKTAEQIRADLDRCIAEYRRLTSGSRWPSKSQTR
jgi:hypothetical protein